MASAAEKRLKALLQEPGTGPVSERDLLLRDTLLLQLARDVGAPLRGVYDHNGKLREEEIARRIREADRKLRKRPSRRRSREGIREADRARRESPLQRRTRERIRTALVWASLILGALAILAAIVALAVRLSLLPEP